MRRAWFVLVSAFVLLVAVVVIGVGAARWVYQNATAPETARLRIERDGDALIRRTGDTGWRVAEDGARVREGDVVSTSSEAIATVEFFDGSHVELMDDTTVEIARMRSSRFLKRTKLVVVEPVRGLVYASMEPSREFGYSEMILRSPTTTITASDEAGRGDKPVFLLELDDSRPQRGTVTRAAALVGTATVESEASGGTVDLSDGQQVVVDVKGEIGAVEPAARQLIGNGDFVSGLEDWGTLANRDQVRPGGEGPVTVAGPLSSAPSPYALNLFPRLSAGAPSTVGVQQEIGSTIREGGSVALSLDVLARGAETSSTRDEDEPPLRIVLTYIDSEGRASEWTHAARLSPDGREPLPREQWTTIRPGEWQRITFDLGHLDPAIRQVTSLVVYASARDYQTTVTNIALTVRELAE